MISDHIVGQQYCTQLRIIKKAGLKPWPTLFKILRSTRQDRIVGNLPCSRRGTGLGIPKIGERSHCR